MNRLAIDSMHNEIRNLKSKESTQKKTLNNAWKLQMELKVRENVANSNFKI